MKTLKLKTVMTRSEYANLNQGFDTADRNAMIHFLVDVGYYTQEIRRGERGRPLTIFSLKYPLNTVVLAEFPLLFNVDLDLLTE